jgi:polyhydroxybutyrate depolymerase
VDKNDCTTVVNETLPDIDPSAESIIVTEKHQNGINNNEVWYYEVAGGGHDWPGAWGNMDIDAGEEAWLFFRMYMDNILSNPSYSNLDKTIRVFPNPAQNIISIENKDATLLIQDVILYDILGIQIETFGNNGTIDLSHLSTGVYLMTIDTSMGLITRKIIKE